MEYNQASKLLLKNLLKYGGIAIKKRASQQSDSQDLETNVKSNLVKVFSGLLGEDYDSISFERNILKKRFSSIPSAKKIIKLLYQFIYVIKMDNIRISEGQIDELSENIKNVVMKLNRLSRFFGIKRPLCIKIDELTKIKKQCFGEQTDDINGAIKFVKDLTDRLKNESIDIQELDNINIDLDSLNKHISVVNKNSENQGEFFGSLKSFFSVLSSKFKDFAERIKTKNYIKEDRKNINKSAEGILSDLKISKIYLEADFEISGELEKSIKDSMKDCIKYCESIYQLTESTAQRLSDLEEKKESTAYSFKSFERVLTLHEKAIEKANTLLKAKNFTSEVSYKPLEEYRNMLKNKDVRILKKKFYDKAVKQIKEGVYKAIAEPKKKESIFGDKKPDSNKVLSELLKALKGVLPGDKQKQLKEAFKNNNIDLSTASSESIINIIKNEPGFAAINKNLSEKIEKVLNHRDISLKLNYKNLFIETLNEDASAWKKIKNSVHVKGTISVDATISSTPASELGYFVHLEKVTVCLLNKENPNML